MADGILFLFGGAGYLAPRRTVRRGRRGDAAADAPGGAARGASARCASRGALTLGLAAGSLGLGPGDTAARRVPRRRSTCATTAASSASRSSGSSSHLFSHAGAHILFVFLLLAGVLLLTGASVAGVVERHAAGRGHDHRAGAGLEAGPGERALGPHHRRRPARCPGESVAPPEPEDSEPVVRATHVEAPALDASERYPDFYEDEEPRRRKRSSEAGRPGARARSPSRCRSRCPSPSRPPRRSSTPAGPPALGGHRVGRHRLPDAEAVVPQALERRAEGRHEGDRARRAAQLVETLSPLQRRRAGDRDRHRAARDALRAAPGARDQDVEGRPAEGRPRLRAGRGAGAHPRADPRQAGGGRGGAQPGAQDGAPRRRLPGGARAAGRRCRSGSARTSPARRSAPTSPSSRTS